MHSTLPPSTPSPEAGGAQRSAVDELLCSYADLRAYLRGRLRRVIGARYATRVADKAVVLRAAIDNVANRNYWSGRFGDGFATLGSARAVRLSATVDF